MIPRLRERVVDLAHLEGEHALDLAAPRPAPRELASPLGEQQHDASAPTFPPFIRDD